MAQRTTYASLSNQDIAKHNVFWGSVNALSEGSFCARLLQDDGASFVVTYHHSNYQVQVLQREGESKITPGAIIKVQFQNAQRSDATISLEHANIGVLAPSVARGLVTHLSAQTAIHWQLFIHAIKDFFYKEGFIEFRTPTLVASPGIEEHIDVFTTEFYRGSKKQKLFLPTSPEFHLKKALTMGWNQIFEIKDCFRNNEDSEIHQPEFTMLEWYRAYSNLDAILTDTEKLLSHLAKRVNTEVKPNKKTCSEVFKEYLDFDLQTNTSKEDLIRLARKHSIEITSNDTWDDIYFRIFIEKIEPYLGKVEPLLLTKYPPSQAALARLTDEGWADRFELYWKGMELANAFHELNDPIEQRRRFSITNEKRKQAGRESIPVDEDFLQALDYGLPPSGGIALGVERLFMCFYNIKTIKEVRGFYL